VLSPDASILYVENEPDDVILLKRAFKKAEIAHPLKIAENGEEAVTYLLGKAPFSDRLANPLPALILLDLSMPLMTGLEFLQWRREEPVIRSIPVIVFTSSRHARDISEAFRLGANAYLVKPASSEGLVRLAETFKQFWLLNSEIPPAASSPNHNVG
jgi:CheY-like chemotaxis protein